MSKDKPNELDFMREVVQHLKRGDSFTWLAVVWLVVIQLILIADSLGRW